MPKTKKIENPSKQLAITWIHSGIGRQQVQKAVIKALGFKKLHQTLIKPDHPSIRGMVKKVEHLVVVKEV